MGHPVYTEINLRKVCKNADNPSIRHKMDNVRTAQKAKTKYIIIAPT